MALHRTSVIKTAVAAGALLAVSSGVALAHTGTAGTTAATTTPAAASHAEAPHAPDGSFAAGTIASITAPSFTVTKADGSTATVTTTDATTIRSTTVVTVADAVVGSSVAVKGDDAADGSVAAERIVVLPDAAADPMATDGPHGGPGGDHLVGTVASNDGSTLTVTKADGTVVTVTTTADTVVVKDATITFADLAVGDTVQAHGTAAADGSIAADHVHVGDLPPRPAGGHGPGPGPEGIPGDQFGPPGTGDGSDDPAGDPGEYAGGAHGIVASVGADSFTVTERDGTVVTVTVSATTVFTKVNGPDHSADTAATFADVTVGALVFVRGTAAADGSVAADEVNICPAGAGAPGGAPNGGPAGFGGPVGPGGPGGFGGPGRPGGGAGPGGAAPGGGQGQAPGGS